MFHPDGMTEMSPAQLGTQFALDVAAMLLAGIVISQLSPGAGFGGRFLVILLLSGFSIVRSEVPSWNWYGFPKRYVAAKIAMELVGCAVGGLIVLKLVRPAALEGLKRPHAIS